MCIASLPPSVPSLAATVNIAPANEKQKKPKEEQYTDNRNTRDSSCGDSAVAGIATGGGTSVAHATRA